MEIHNKIQNNLGFIWNIEILHFSIPHIGKLGKQYVNFFHNGHKIIKKPSFYLTKISKNIKKKQEIKLAILETPLLSHM